jgi:hypothetical protein
MNKLTIHLLGDAQFRLNDGPPLPLEAGKASALLAYLAVEAARPHARQTLAELLWPERADADAPWRAAFRPLEPARVARRPASGVPFPAG